MTAHRKNDSAHKEPYTFTTKVGIYFPTNWVIEPLGKLDHPFQCPTYFPYEKQCNKLQWSLTWKNLFASLCHVSYAAVIPDKLPLCDFFPSEKWVDLRKIFTKRTGTIFVTLQIDSELHGCRIYIYLLLSCICSNLLSIYSGQEGNT